jgi:putative transposase
VFATVRHRTIRTIASWRSDCEAAGGGATGGGGLSQNTARLMVFKLVMTAARTWRKLKGENQPPKVIQGH